MDESQTFSKYRVIGNPLFERTMDDCAQMQLECRAMRWAAAYAVEQNKITHAAIEMSREIIANARSRS